MENSNQIANRFAEVILNGKWIANTNFKDLISDLDWKQANTKIGSLNTIAMLTYHINYYIAGLNKVFEGENLEISDKYSFDLPEIKSQKEWEKLCNDLWQNAATFANHVKQLSKEKLDGDFVKKEYGSYRRNIEGVIEHSYYHLGQVALIKKMILEAETK